jgi:hypothetical protein
MARRRPQTDYSALRFMVIFLAINIVGLAVFFANFDAIVSNARKTLGLPQPPADRRR